MSAALAYALDDDGPELVSTSVGDLDADEVVAEAWRRGDLSWKLDPHQLEVIEQFLSWDQRRKEAGYADAVVANDASYDDVFVHEAGRRVGKTHLWLSDLIGFAIRHPGCLVTYATAFQKDIGEIIVPLADIICVDAPDDVRPRYRKSQGEGHEGLYFPEDIGSVIKLVGVDKHPDALRGRFSDRAVFSEAGFIKGLEYLVASVMLPQFQRRPWASLVLESSTSKNPEHDFLRIFCEDARKRGAYRMQTIDDNTAIDPREKEKALRQAGGRGHPNCEREYYCVPTRDAETVVVPEFDPSRHVCIPPTLPEYADSYVAVDPGVSDQCAVIWAYWDFERARLVVQRSWAERNANTTKVADVIKTTERELWDDFRAWDDAKGEFRHSAPLMRVSDVDLRLIIDLQVEHGISIHATAKDNAEAQLFALRTAFQNGQIVILPNSGPLEAQLIAATRKEGGGPMDWERSKVHGHYDCLVGGTLIATERGDVPIEEVRIGDRVWTRRGLRSVTNAWCAGVRPIWRLETEAGTIEGTRDHRVWTAENGWRELGMLTRSDTVCAWASSASAKRSTTLRLHAPSAEFVSSATDTQSPAVARCAVLSCTETGRSERVYDLTVEGEHEFFANGVLVHNCVAALMYLWRNVVRTRNPNPPEHVLVKGDRFIEPHAERAPKHVAKLSRVLGGGFGRRGRW